MGYDIKSIKEEFKSKGIYYTPPELGEYLASFLPKGITEVYDPTCGRGNLLACFSDDVKKYGQDINADEVEEARQRLVNFEGVAADTLKEPAWLGRKFEAIVANYPFSIKWEPVEDERFQAAPCVPTKSRADYAFLLHILYYLSESGTAVTLNFPGILYRGQREGKIRRWMVESNYIDQVVRVGGDKFTDTSIETCVLVLKKNRKDTAIKFVDLVSGKDRLVDQEEIKENDYTLSVNVYLPEETVKKDIDPKALELDCRAVMEKRLRSHIRMSILVASLQGDDLGLDEHLDRLINIINEERRKR